MTAPLNLDVACDECGLHLEFGITSSSEIQIVDTIRYSAIHGDHIVSLTIKDQQITQQIILLYKTKSDEMTEKFKNMVSGLTDRNWNNIVIVSTFEIQRSTFIVQMLEKIGEKDMQIKKIGNCMKFRDGLIDYTFFTSYEIDQNLMGEPDLTYVDFLQHEDIVPLQDLRNISILITESKMTVIYLNSREQQEFILKWLDEELRMHPGDYLTPDERGIDEYEHSVMILKPGRIERQ